MVDSTLVALALLAVASLASMMEALFMAASTLVVLVLWALVGPVAMALVAIAWALRDLDLKWRRPL